MSQIRCFGFCTGMTMAGKTFLIDGCEAVCMWSSTMVWYGADWSFFVDENLVWWGDSKRGCGSMRLYPYECYHLYQWSLSHVYELCGESFTLTVEFMAGFGATRCYSLDYGDFHSFSCRFSGERRFQLCFVVMWRICFYGVWWHVEKMVFWMVLRFFP